MTLDPLGPPEFHSSTRLRFTEKYFDSVCRIFVRSIPDLLFGCKYNYEHYEKGEVENKGTSPCVSVMKT